MFYKHFSETISLIQGKIILFIPCFFRVISASLLYSLSLLIYFHFTASVLAFEKDSVRDETSGH